MDSQQDFRTLVLLSLQRALWGMVTPDLVAVAVGWSSRRIHARFVYESAITPQIAEIVREVETSVLADFPAETETDFRAEVGSASSASEFQEGEAWWAYRRRDA